MTKKVLLVGVLLCFPLAAGAGGGKNWLNAKGKQQKSGKETRGEPTRKAPKRAGTVASPNAIRAKQTRELVFHEPIRYHNLSLVPVSTTQTGPFEKYTLLEEGLAAKTLAVRELNGRSGDAQVPAVEVRNTGKRPVYLLGGEMILGGKQDRIISADTVLPNSGKWIPVRVFCVEQGRWQGQQMSFRSGGALAHLALQKAAMSGNQGAVWAEVARKNLRHGTQSDTSTYRRTIQNAEVRAKITPYRKAIAQKLPPDKKLAGIVFAINGEIRVVDLFGNPVLYAALQDKLLSAYILEALGHQVVRNAPSVSADKAATYLYDARKARKVKLKGSGRSVNYRKENKSMIGNETVDQDTGKTLRETYLAH